MVLRSLAAVLALAAGPLRLTAQQSRLVRITDPRKIVAWMGEEATVDPRPDGVCRIVINGAPMLGRFTHVELPSRLAFTWGFEERLFDVPPQSSCVEVALTGDGDGTLVRVSHRRLPPGATSFHRAGWCHYLERLETTLGGGAPGPDPWANPTL